jgi:hypothetical protein
VFEDSVEIGFRDTVRILPGTRVLFQGEDAGFEVHGTVLGSGFPGDSVVLLARDVPPDFAFEFGDSSSSTFAFALFEGAPIRLSGGELHLAYARHAGTAPQRLLESHAGFLGLLCADLGEMASDGASRMQQEPCPDAGNAPPGPQGPGNAEGLPSIARYYAADPGQSLRIGFAARGMRDGNRGDSLPHAWRTALPFAYERRFPKGWRAILTGGLVDLSTLSGPERLDPAIEARAQAEWEPASAFLVTGGIHARSGKAGSAQPHPLSRWMEAYLFSDEERMLDEQASANLGFSVAPLPHFTLGAGYLLRTSYAALDAKERADDPADTYAYVIGYEDARKGLRYDGHFTYRKYLYESRRGSAVYRPGDGYIGDAGLSFYAGEVGFDVTACFMHRAGSLYPGSLAPSSDIFSRPGDLLGGSLSIGMPMASRLSVSITPALEFARQGGSGPDLRTWWRGDATLAGRYSLGKKAIDASLKGAYLYASYGQSTGSGETEALSEFLGAELDVTGIFFF